MPKAKEQAVGNLATDMVVVLNDRAAGQNGQRARAGARQLEAMESANTPISTIGTHAPA